MDDTLRYLATQYGPLMTSEEVARVLRYPTVPALRMALRRKKIALERIDMPGRRQLLFATEDVADCLNSFGRKGEQGREEPVTPTNKVRRKRRR